MDIALVKEIVDENCPNDKSSYVWDDGQKDVGSSMLPHWRFCVYRDGNAGMMGIETIITEQTLSDLNKRDIETMARMFKSALDRKESSISSS